MSDEARAARLEWLGDLWAAYRADVAAARGIDEEALDRYARELHLGLESIGGDAAALALSEGLIDEVAPRDRVRERLIELAGEDEESGSYNSVDHFAYLAIDESSID